MIYNYKSTYTFKKQKKKSNMWYITIKPSHACYRYNHDFLLMSKQPQNHIFIKNKDFLTRYWLNLNHLNYKLKKLVL